MPSARQGWGGVAQSCLLGVHIHQEAAPPARHPRLGQEWVYIVSISKDTPHHR